LKPTEGICFKTLNGSPIKDFAFLMETSNGDPLWTTKPSGLIGVA